MEKVYTLTQDNGGCNDFKKLTVKIIGSDLVRELKNFFRWRKDVTVKRLFKEGSSKFDSFVKYLSERGY